MKAFLFFLPFLFSLQACKAPKTLLEAREGHQTRLIRKESIGELVATPPAETSLKLTGYEGPLGRNMAYVSTPPGDGKKHPAIIWLIGGFSNSISDTAWTPGPPENDQSASGFRKHDIIMLYPSLRGGNTNPGHIEAFYGEVNDVIAAAKYLASLDYVDPDRIYIGGHSTGGTLALLVAEAGGIPLRAVFSLGPVEDVASYGSEILPFNINNSSEVRLRSPGEWLSMISCPTYIFEGTESPGNSDSLKNLQALSENPKIHFKLQAGDNHFSIIRPLIEEISRNIITDQSVPLTTPFSFRDN